MPDTSLTGPFASLPDPRGHRGCQYSLTSLITIAVSAAIRAAEDWVAAFGRAKADWFRTFLDLPDDTPSHDTFDRVFARIDREGWGHWCHDRHEEVEKHLFLSKPQHLSPPESRKDAGGEDVILFNHLIRGGSGDGGSPGIHSVLVGRGEARSFLLWTTNPVRRKPPA